MLAYQAKFQSWEGEMKKTFLGAVFVAILSFSFLGPANAADPIRVGICKPFSGPVGFIGQDLKPGFEMALEEINGAGGVLGRALALYYADNQCNPTEGVNAARKLIDLDKVSVVLAGGLQFRYTGDVANHSGGKDPHVDPYGNQSKNYPNVRGRRKHLGVPPKRG